MAEYIANAQQTVALNAPITFTNVSIPCKTGCVINQSGSGVFILRGKTPCQCQSARYEVEFTGNISIPTGGTVTPIATAITVNGVADPSSLSISTPAAIDNFGNVNSRATVEVPCGCCFTVSAVYASGVTDGTTTPTPTINVQNAKITVNRTA